MAYGQTNKQTDGKVGNKTAFCIKFLFDMNSSFVVDINVFIYTLIESNV